MPTFRSDQLNELEAWLQQKTSGGLVRGIQSAAFRGLGAIQNEIIPEEKPQPVDRGAYRAAWKVETTDKGADLVNTLPYAPVIEYGARPENVKVGRRMIEALAEWARRKGFQPDGVPKGSGDKAYESIAWAIAMAMKKRGVFNRDGKGGLRVAEKAVAKIRGFIAQEIAREMKR